MQGDLQVIQALNDILTAELTAISQYYVHHKMCENWGYQKLAAKKKEESLEEMHHADIIIERIFFLDGVPNLQKLNAIRVGQDPVEQHQLDLDLELVAAQRLNKAIALCCESADNGTRELLNDVLKDEEDSIDWLEAQLHIIKEIGKDRYLAEQIHS